MSTIIAYDYVAQEWVSGEHARRVLCVQIPQDIKALQSREYQHLIGITSEEAQIAIDELTRQLALVQS